MQTEVQKQIEAKGYTPSLIMKLRNEAERNPVFKAVCQGFALRKRTRAQITVASLTQKMTNEGFEYSRDQYKQVLTFMGNLGLGSIQMSNSGKVKALKDIKVTLQSIGMAAVGNEKQLSRAHVANKFKPLPKPLVEPKVEKEHAKTMAGKIGMEVVKKTYKAELVVHFAKDEVTTFQLPNGITEQQLGSFLARYYNNKGV